MTTRVVTIGQQSVTTPSLAPITISAATIGRGRGQVIQAKPGMVTLTPQSLKAIPQVIRPQTTGKGIKMTTIGYVVAEFKFYKVN